MESKFNHISGLNALHLRPGYFMESTLPQVGVIQNFGVVAGPLRPDLGLPMTAIKDIGTVPAEALLKLDFSGQQTRELLGQRDIYVYRSGSHYWRRYWKARAPLQATPSRPVHSGTRPDGYEQELR
jgi:hypothetical protein